jgi:hypothetical protein
MCRGAWVALLRGPSTSPLVVDIHMKHSDFRIGLEFWCGQKRWRCTDVGTRIITAISLESHEVVELSTPRGAFGQPEDAVTPQQTLVGSVARRIKLRRRFLTSTTLRVAH